MNWTLRAALAADAEAMAAIHASVAQPGWSARDFSTWLARDEAIAVLVTHDESPAAFALALIGGDDADILMIATASQMQRQGAGGATLRALSAEAARRDVRRLVLEVARNNQPALALYGREGFVEIGVRPGYYRQAGGLVDAIVLARAVSP
jgi:ribosomal protein S18 acetylase RimI-like enzyme